MERKNSLNMKSSSENKLHISGPLEPQLQPTDQIKMLMGNSSNHFWMPTIY